MVAAQRVWDIAWQQVAEACRAFHDTQPHLRSAGLTDSDPSEFRATLLIAPSELASDELLQADLTALLAAVTSAGFAFVEDPKASGSKTIDLALPVDLGPHIDALEAAEQQADDLGN